MSAIINTPGSKSGAIGLMGGVTVADQWRLNTSESFAAGDHEIDNYLEQVSGRGQGTLGSAMTQSGGIFTFPSTGIWQIFMNLDCGAASNDFSRYNQAKIFATVNDSTYEQLARGNNALVYGASDSHGVNMSCQSLFHVEATSSHKVKFKFQNAQTITLEANDDYNITTFTFIRLGHS